MKSVIGFRVRLQNPKSGFSNRTQPRWLLGWYNGKPSTSRAECPNLKPRQDRVSLITTCFSFRLFFLSFIFNFFFINISFSELQVITVSLFVQIDGLVHVMTLDGQYQDTKRREIKAFIFHHDGKWKFYGASPFQEFSLPFPRPWNLPVLQAVNNIRIGWLGSRVGLRIGSDWYFRF